MSNTPGYDQDELTGGDAAELLGLSRQRVNKLAHEGKIPARHVAGRFWLFKRADVEAFKAKAKSKGGRPKKRAVDHDGHAARERSPQG